MSELRDRNDILEKKKDELNQIISKAFDAIYIADNINSTKPIVDFYKSGFINITAPQEEPPMMHMLTMDSLRNYQKGESIKPGNIRLNFKNLINSLPEITTLVVSVFADIPILKICAALSVWKVLRDIMTVEITKSQAVIIYALWKNCSKENKIKLEEGFNNANNLIRNIEETELTWDKYVETVEELEKLECLEIDETGVCLCECISRKYR